MRDYLTLLGAAHAGLGGLTAALGLLVVLLAATMGLYGVYDAWYTLVYLIDSTDPIHYWYPIEGMIEVLVMSAIFSTPGLLLTVVGALGLFAGVGVLRRWRMGRKLAFASAVPSFALGFPGMLLAIGTFVVLLDPDVRREFEPV